MASRADSTASTVVQRVENANTTVSWPFEGGVSAGGLELYLALGQVKLWRWTPAPARNLGATSNFGRDLPTVTKLYTAIYLHRFLFQP